MSYQINKKNKIFNENFINLYKFIHIIKNKLDKKLSINNTSTSIHISINKQDNLVFNFIISYFNKNINIERIFFKYRILEHLIKENEFDNFIDMSIKKITNKLNNIKNEYIENELKLKDDDIITVCSECLTASCWHGEFMCEKAYEASIIEKTIKELKELNLEHPDNWKKQFQITFNSNNETYFCPECGWKEKGKETKYDTELSREICPECENLLENLGEINDKQ